METNREITIIDLAKLLLLPDYYMTLAPSDDERVYKICTVEVCPPQGFNVGNIFYCELDGDDPITTSTFTIDSDYIMYTQPESAGILIEDRHNNIVAAVEVIPKIEMPSIDELLSGN